MISAKASRGRCSDNEKKFPRYVMVSMVVLVTNRNISLNQNILCFSLFIIFATGHSTIANIKKGPAGTMSDSCLTCFHKSPAGGLQQLSSLKDPDRHGRLTCTMLKMLWKVSLRVGYSRSGSLFDDSTVGQSATCDIRK